MSGKKRSKASKKGKAGGTVGTPGGGTHLQRALDLRRSGDLQGAVSVLLRAVDAEPRNPQVHNELALALWDLGDLRGARSAYLKALEIDDSIFAVLNNLGHLCWVMGEHHEAVRHLRKALQVSPGDARVLLNLGNACAAAGLEAEAEKHYLEAIRVDPRFAEPYNSLAGLLNARGELSRAIDMCRKAVAIDPDHLSAYGNMAGPLVGTGRFEEGLQLMRELFRTKGPIPFVVSNYLFMLHYDPSQSPRNIWKEHRNLGLERETLIRREPDERPFVRPKKKDGSRLRVGYVSPDFKCHSVAYFADPLLEGHDRQRFEVVCYSDTKREDEWTKKFQGHADEWYKAVGMGDRELTQKIREDRIDILVDLAGHTGENRMGVFARRAAPVQVTYLGYPDTTGLETMDYRLTDPWADPEGMTDHLHTEKLVRLPRGFLCYRPPSGCPSVQPPPCLDRGHVTFGSFNNRSKINDKVVDTWTTILERSPHSRMLIKCQALADGETRDVLARMFMDRGIGEDRVRLVGKIPSVLEHLAFYGEVDIALDTFPYHGTTTTCEALWMGVPVITLVGDAHVSRVGLSLLSRVGLEDLAVNSLDEYVARALVLARDTDRLRAWRMEAREKMSRSPLMDVASFVGDVETAFSRMWNECCGKRDDVMPRGEKPHGVADAREDEREMARKILDGISHELCTRMLIEGEEHFSQGRMAEASRCFARVTRQTGDQALLCRAYNNMGVVAHGMGETEKAEKMFMTALENDPLDAHAFSNLSEIRGAGEREILRVEEPGGKTIGR